MTDSSALATSVITSLLIFAVIFALFLVLSRRPGLAVIFFPARILSGAGPPPDGSFGPFKWMRDVLSTPQERLAAIAGLDAAVYICFLRTCLNILVWSLIYCVPVIISTARTDNFYESFNADPANEPLAYTDIDLLALGNIAPKSQRLWVGIIGGYWITIGCIFFLGKAYSDIVALRAKFFADASPNPEQYAALVRDIPKMESKKLPEAVDEFFGRIYGSFYRGANVVPNMSKVTKECNDVIKLKKKLAHAEGVFELSKTEELPEGERPMTRSGFMGCCGAKVDAIEFYTEELRKAAVKLKEEQEVASTELGNAAFIFFENKQMAAAAAQVMHAENTDSWDVIPAPEPRDVVWGNLRLGEYERRVRSMVVYGVVFLTIVFYMIPITFISSITTLANLQKTLTFLKPIVKISALRTVLQAYLPQLALIIFLAILPSFLTFLSTLEGIPAKSHICRAASGKYFYFIVFNVFLGVTLGGSLQNSIKQFSNSTFSQIIETLGSSIPPQATFFISFIALKFLVSKALELSRLVRIIIYSLKKKYLCKTEEELLEAWAPGQLDYLSLVPNDLLIITITICYAVIAPLILPFGVAYFIFSWFIMKNQALNVYHPEWESRGRMWPNMHSRIICALLLSQLTLFGYFGIKKFAYTFLLIPLPIITAIYYFMVQQRYYRTFCVNSLDVASRGNQNFVPSTEFMLYAYTPEAMKAPEEVGLDEERQVLLLKTEEEKREAKGMGEKGEAV